MVLDFLGLALFRPQVFNRVDIDNNGTLDPREVEGLAAALGVMLTEVQLAAAFTDMDADRSGTVDIREFEAWWSTNMEAWLAQASAEAVGCRVI